MLDAGNQWNRDHILRNQKAGKKFMVKKAMPQKYREVEKVLNAMAMSLCEVNMHVDSTEVGLKGTSLSLMVREKKTAGSSPSEWEVYHEIDLLRDKASKPGVSFKMKEKGKSILVSMNHDSTSTAIFETTLKNYLEGYNDLKYTMVDKKRAVICCKEEDDAIRAEAKLKVELKDAWILRI